MHPSPIFVLGHPKSGTTAIAALLARTSGERWTDDLFPQVGLSREEKAALFTEPDAFAAFLARYPQYFATRINKSPKLTFLYRELRRHFPAARYVYVVRDPRSALRSFLGWRGIPGDLDAIDNPAQRRQLDVLPPQPPGHYVDRLAHRWNQAADIYLNDRDRMVLARYEDFSADPVATVRRVALAAGLSASIDISSATSVRYKSSKAAGIPWRDFFGPAGLSRIENICRERMRSFGYE